MIEKPFATSPEFSNRQTLRAVSLWLFVQAGILALSLARVRLWIDGGRDDDALRQSLAISIALSALIWPALFPNWRAAIAVMLASIPFIQLAGLLAAAPLEGQMLGAIALLCWLATLALLAQVSTGWIARGIVNAAVFGPILLTYAAAESNAGRISLAGAGPIGAAIQLADGKGFSIPALAWLLIPLALAGAALAIERQRTGTRRRAFVS